MSYNAFLAKEIVKNIDEHFPSDPLVRDMRQALCLAEEAGEAAGAVRRYLGQARRTGTFEDAMAELADVIITTYVMAHQLGGDLDEAIDQKAAKIFTRGWKDLRSE